MIIILILLAIITAILTCFLSLYWGRTNSFIIPIIISAVLAGIFQFLIQIWSLPTIGFFYPATWFSLILAGLIGAGVGHLFSDPIGYAAPGIIFLLFLIIYLPSSCETFHAKRYRTLLGDVKQKDFKKTIPQIKLKDIRLVPKWTAYILAKKVLGQAKGGTVLGSQLKIDTKRACIQEVKGKLWWIFPLDFNGYFKWSNRKIVPGYIRVNAQDPTKEAELVEYDKKSKTRIKIRYTLNSYFSYWLERKIYNKFPTIYNEDFTFEVDDNWRPYYVVSATSPEIGFSGYKTRGVIIADPQSGEINYYSIKNIPSWVDRVIPIEQAKEHITYWGEYVHGWWNTVFSEKDIQVPTSYSYGRDLWFIKVGKKKYWFTGMTSISSRDQSLVGAIMMNTRNGKTIYFSIHGTDENGVLQTVDAALGADSARWYPAQPIPYNLYGVPTWILPIVSNEGIFQRIAMVDMDNINTIAIDKDINRALEKYRVALTQHNSSVSIDSTGMRKIGPVSIARVGNTVISGNKIFYILLNGHENVLFSSSGETEKTRLITIAKPGDIVSVKFIKTRSPIIPIESINIKGIKLRN